MRVYIPKGNSIALIQKEILTENCFAAYWGFSLMGWEVVFYEDKPPEGLSREDVIVGFIYQVKHGLRNLGITPPDELDYPEEIRSYLGRNIWQSTLNKIYTDETSWPVFVKPVKGKEFDGKLITKLGDLAGLGSQDNDRKIWCSEPVDFISEYRCFVRYGKIMDARRYKGDYRVVPNFDIVESCIKDFKSQPASYGLDFGVTKDGRTLLVEANDGYAMGTYGLNASFYAQVISARWHEMVGIPDPCQF